MIRRKLLKQSAVCVLGLSLFCAADGVNTYAAQGEEVIQNEEQAGLSAEEGTKGEENYSTEDSGISDGSGSSESGPGKSECFEKESVESTVQNDGTKVNIPEKSDETAADIQGTDQATDSENMAPEEDSENEAPEVDIPESDPAPVLNG